MEARLRPQTASMLHGERRRRPPITYPDFKVVVEMGKYKVVVLDMLLDNLLSVFRNTC